MKSRFLAGSVVIAVIGATLGGAALAQRADAPRSFLEHSRERRLKVASDDPVLRIIRAPGDYRFSFTFDGIAREYLVHVPTSYRAPGPMLLALHGGGGDADYQSDDKRYKLISKSEQSGFVAVFPNGYSRRSTGVLATWNAGACCGAAVEDRSNDVGFLREVIRRVEKQASVDANRVFVTGMSNGALMSWRLACEAADLIRGIAPVEGTDNTRSCAPTRPVAVIEFHARNDDHIPLGGGRGASALTTTAFTSVADTQVKWIAFDHANPQAIPVLRVPGARCDLHRAAADGAPVELCLTDDGGHSWPGGGDQQGRKQPSTAISANDLMWSFFSSL